MTYLDHAATTPMLPEALEAYVAAAGGVGNASSLHAQGRQARRRVEEARERIAAAIGASPSEVIFTGGGTESDNLAIKGMFWASRAADGRRKRIVTSAIEHHAVLDAVAWLERHEGATVTWLPVDRAGRVPIEAYAEAIAGDDVAVAAVMFANNEVGTVQPIHAMAVAAAERGVAMHTDAVQALGQIQVSFAETGVAAMTVTSHKVGGPAGVGVLVLRRNVGCTPLLHGGGQERDLRSGTLDTPGIVGMATAVEIAVKSQAEFDSRVGRLRDLLVRRVLETVPEAVLNGVPVPEPAVGAGSASGAGPAGCRSRLPANAHFSFPGCEGDALLLLLDAKGIACSTGSACSAGLAQPSHVLTAMGAGDDLARSSLRFSLGSSSTVEDVEALLAVLPAAVERARIAGALRRA